MIWIGNEDRVGEMKEAYKIFEDACLVGCRAM
jgi:hypothetical protein